MATVYMVWHGGVNYASSTSEDRTEHESEAAAVEAFSRMTSADPYYPGAYSTGPKSERPTAWLYYGTDPVTMDDPYPHNEIVWRKGEPVIRPI